MVGCDSPLALILSSILWRMLKCRRNYQRTRWCQLILKHWCQQTMQLTLNELILMDESIRWNKMFYYDLNGNIKRKNGQFDKKDCWKRRLQSLTHSQITMWSSLKQFEPLISPWWTPIWELMQQNVAMSSIEIIIFKYIWLLQTTRIASKQIHNVSLFSVW